MGKHVSTGLIAAVLAVIIWVALDKFVFTGMESSSIWIGAPIIFVVVLGLTILIGSSIAKSKGRR